MGFVRSRAMRRRGLVRDGDEDGDEAGDEDGDAAGDLRVSKGGGELANRMALYDGDIAQQQAWQRQIGARR